MLQTASAAAHQRPSFNPLSSCAQSDQSLRIYGDAFAITGYSQVFTEIEFVFQLADSGLALAESPARMRA